MDKEIPLVIAVIIIGIILFIGVIVGALVVVGLGLQVVDSPQAGVPETQSKAIWKSASPVSIIDWSRNNDSLLLSAKNTGSQTITIDSITIKGITATNLPSKEITPGGSLLITIPNIGTCSTGSHYSLSKNEIAIHYSVVNGIKDFTEHAPADLVGTC